MVRRKEITSLRKKKRAPTLVAEGKNRGRGEKIPSTPNAGAKEEYQNFNKEGEPERSSFKITRKNLTGNLEGGDQLCTSTQ